ncbi:GNAT family N-acetyltransferase [Rosenbergiella nectarea]|uniref:GNAT family N-acetyltransferase n=1 Tax=Rosenbergiella nectarea TaxID=988801 RepID=UPI001BDA64EF|nr:GNAT family N-acetyltransferase [Rosenbergiella nectarea]MBT0730617.1 GNAT family N-acetyltransferase [Rosenbergiella nectarea subsp. apis]
MKITWEFTTGDKIIAKDLYAVLLLRNKVFIVEQACHYQDIDGLDLNKDSIHIRGLYEGQCIAYSRIVNYDSADTPSVIGRVIIDSSFRGQQLGVKLITNTVDYLKRNKNCHSVQLSAQSHLINFYEKFGFSVASKEYLEDGIPHTDMTLVL